MRFRLGTTWFLVAGFVALEVSAAEPRRKPDLSRVLNVPPSDCNLVLRQQFAYVTQEPLVLAEMERHIARLREGSRIADRTTFPTRESVLEGWSALKSIHSTLDRTTVNKDIGGKVAAALDARFPGRERTGKGLIAATRRFFPSVEEGAALVGVELVKGVQQRPESPIPGGERFATEPLSSATVDANRALAESIIKGTDEYQFQFYGKEKQTEHDGLVWAMHFSRYRAQEARRNHRPESEIQAHEKNAELMMRALVLVHRKLPSYMLKKVSHYFRTKRGGVEGDDKNDAYFLSVAEKSMKGALLRLDPNRARLTRYALSRFFGHYQRAMQKLDKLVNLVDGEGNGDILSRIGEATKGPDDEAGGINARMLLIVALQRLEARDTPGMQVRYRRNAEILRRWYGIGREELDYAEPQTMKQIGDIMGVSSTRVQQIMPAAESDLGIVIGEMKAEFEAMNQRERLDRDDADYELDDL